MQAPRKQLSQIVASTPWMVDVLTAAGAAGPPQAYPRGPAVAVAGYEQILIRIRSTQRALADAGACALAARPAWAAAALGVLGSRERGGDGCESVRLSGAW